MKFIKPIAEDITSPIVNRINSSIDKEIFPNRWKVAIHFLFANSNPGDTLKEIGEFEI